MDWAEVARVACDVHRASQRADELAEALALVADLAPSVIVEIGCDAGGTLYAWRQVCQRVYGITLADNSAATGGGGGPLVDHGATVYIGDSHDAAARDWLLRRLHPVNVDERSIDVLVVDGDHHVSAVRADLATYGPLVRPGGLVLLHDIASASDPRAEVHRLWPELVDRFETSEIRSTQHQPYGWGVIHVRGGESWA